MNFSYILVTVTFTLACSTCNTNPSSSDIPKIPTEPVIDYDLDDNGKDQQLDSQTNTYTVTHKYFTKGYKNISAEMANVVSRETFQLTDSGNPVNVSLVCSC